MANQAAKKRRAENEGIMKRMRYLLLLVNLLYVALRVVWMNDSFGFWHWVGFGGCSLVNVLVYWWIASLATPTYDATGDLIDGGADLNTHGNLSEYAFDVVYIVVFVQLTTIISEYFWFILLVIPAFAGYKLLGLVLGGLSGSGGPAAEETKEEKRKREKMERKMNRPKFQKARR